MTDASLMRMCIDIVERAGGSGEFEGDLDASL